jgi:hypothetical protein
MNENTLNALAEISKHVLMFFVENVLASAPYSTYDLFTTPEHFSETSRWEGTLRVDNC